MTDFNYYIYDDNDLITGFSSLCVAVTFCEDWRVSSRSISINLVDSNTVKMIDTCINRQWENGSF